MNIETLTEVCREVWNEAVKEDPAIAEELTFEEYVEECRIEAAQDVA